MEIPYLPKNSRKGFCGGNTPCLPAVNDKYIRASPKDSQSISIRLLESLLNIIV